MSGVIRNNALPGRDCVDPDYARRSWTVGHATSAATFHQSWEPVADDGGRDSVTSARLIDREARAERLRIGARGLDHVESIIYLSSPVCL